ncbi:MAG: cob(I)yrinic acid a,c-diamide adenosyltransferase [Spirochaetaceae bacterium]|nr:MAG: cob(I)yrinic acid a,c-diamide adenosyltransferase [Spirochaetaceae bacterium]
MSDEFEFEKVTTRGGDGGSSSIYSGERYSKDDITFSSVGDIDEFSSALGLARSWLATAAPHTGLAEIVEGIQRDLISVGGLVATAPGHENYALIPPIDEKSWRRIEDLQKGIMPKTAIGDRFILPGEHEGSARLDMARSVCRRAERTLVSFIRVRYRTDLYECQRYLNRVSDYLFILGRYVEQHCAD